MRAQSTTITESIDKHMAVISAALIDVVSHRLPRDTTESQAQLAALMPKRSEIDRQIHALLEEAVRITTNRARQ